jgi:hypothetical protein
MATLINVTLNLQKTGSPVSTSPRTAIVTFTTRFSLAEMQSGALFIADVRLEAMENGMVENPRTTLNMGSASVEATSILVQRTLTMTFTRSTLDEDRDRFIFYDQYGHPHLFSEELEDEWRARVILTPIIQTVTRNSPVVRGSWGAEGND